MSKAARSVQREAGCGSGHGLAVAYLAALADQPRRRLSAGPARLGLLLDELDDLLRVQLLRLAMREAERTLKPPFPADLVWAELAEVERHRSETALELLRLSRHQRLQGMVVLGTPRRRCGMWRICCDAASGN